jgi:transcriptional regulator with XRE-family HTH domain
VRYLLEPWRVSPSGRPLMPREVRQEAEKFARRVQDRCASLKSAGKFKGAQGAWIVKQFDLRFPEAKEKPPGLSGKRGAGPSQHAVSPATVSKWVKAKALPSEDNLIRLAAVLECPLEYLTTGDAGDGYRPADVAQAVRDRASIMAFRSFAELAGATCIEPSAKDPRAMHVDLDLWLHDCSLSVLIPAAERVGLNLYNVVLPRTVKAGTSVIVAVQVSAFRLDFVRLEPRLVQTLMKAKRPGKSVSLQRRNDSYAVDELREITAMADFDSLFEQD